MRSRIDGIRLNSLEYEEVHNITQFARTRVRRIYMRGTTVIRMRNLNFLGEKRLDYACRHVNGNLRGERRNRISPRESNRNRYF